MTDSSPDDRGPELAEVTDELYGLDPGDFVPARNELVRRLRKDGHRGLAKQVAELRRPSPAAWAVNQLTRSYRTELDGLLRLGDALRTAQTHTLAGADAADLRNAGRARRDAVARLAESTVGLLVQRGAGVGGHYAEVAATLEAASLDPDAAAEVSGGHLTSSLEPPSGFGDLDSDPAKTMTDAAPSTSTRQAEEPNEPLEDEPAVATELAERLAEARGDAADARRVTKSTAGAAREAAESARQRQREVDEAETDLVRMRQALEKAAQRAEASHRRSDQAEQTADEARQAVVRAEAAEAEAVARLDEAEQRVREPRAARRREP